VTIPLRLVLLIYRSRTEGAAGPQLLIRRTEVCLFRSWPPYSRGRVTCPYPPPGTPVIAGSSAPGKTRNRFHLSAWTDDQLRIPHTASKQQCDKQQAKQLSTAVSMKLKTYNLNKYSRTSSTQQTYLKAPTP